MPTTISEDEEELVTGNHFDKYASKNPIHRFLMRRFLDSAHTLLTPLSYRSVLEVGCGAGELAEQLFASEDLSSQHLEEPRSIPSVDVDYIGIDIGGEEIRKARQRCPGFQFTVASAYQLPVGDQSQDLVVACEVLEHLEDVDAALFEIQRVAASHVLISVPCEPMWRGLNLLRGKYWRSFGNTPGHVQHFSASGIQQVVRKYFTIERVVRPLPWTMMMAKTKC